jgi:hypothetical protein
MPMVSQHFVIFNAAVSIPFMAEATADADLFVAGALGPVTANATISKNGAALGALTGTTISNPGAGKLFLLNISAADAAFRRLDFLITDAGTNFKDVWISIETQLDLGSLVVNATNYPGNVDAIKASGVGAGNGITAVAGASGRITNLFDTTLGTEPAVAFNVVTSTAGQMLQLLGMRWFHKVRADAGTLTMFKADSVAVLGTGATITVASGVVTRGRFT